MKNPMVNPLPLHKSNPLGGGRVPDRKLREKAQIHRLIHDSLQESLGLGTFLITNKAADARRQGAMSEAYGAIRRKEERAKATQPFGSVLRLAQDGERSRTAQGYERVEWQMASWWCIRGKVLLDTSSSFFLWFPCESES